MGVPSVGARGNEGVRATPTVQRGPTVASHAVHTRAAEGCAISMGDPGGGQRGPAQGRNATRGAAYLTAETRTNALASVCATTLMSSGGVCRGGSTTQRDPPFIRIPTRAGRMRVHPGTLPGVHASGQGVSPNLCLHAAGFLLRARAALRCERHPSQQARGMPGTLTVGGSPRAATPLTRGAASSSSSDTVMSQDMRRRYSQPYAGGSRRLISPAGRRGGLDRPRSPQAGKGGCHEIPLGSLCDRCGPGIRPNNQRQRPGESSPGRSLSTLVCRTPRICPATSATWLSSKTLFAMRSLPGESDGDSGRPTHHHHLPEVITCPDA